MTEARFVQDVELLAIVVVGPLESLILLFQLLNRVALLLQLFCQDELGLQRRFQVFPELV